MKSIFYLFVWVLWMLIVLKVYILLKKWYYHLNHKHLGLLFFLFGFWVAFLIDPGYLDSGSVYFMAPVVSNMSSSLKSEILSSSESEPESAEEQARGAFESELCSEESSEGTEVVSSLGAVPVCNKLEFLNDVSECTDVAIRGRNLKMLKNVSFEGDVASLKKYVVQARHVFVTISHYECDFEELCSYFFDTESYLSLLMACYEKHEQGAPHMHIYLKFSNQRVRHSLSWLAFFKKPYNIQSVRNVHATINYIKKDGVYFERSRVDMGLPGKGVESSRLELSKHIYDNGLDVQAGIHSFVKKFKSSTVNVHEVNNFIKLMGGPLSAYYKVPELRHIVALQSRVRFLGFKNLKNHEDDPNYKLLSFIEEGLCASPYMASRRKHLYLYGDSLLGKSMLFSLLCRIIPHYRYPDDGWHSAYVNGLYQMIFWDECTFTGTKTERLNMFFGGVDKVELNVKGGRAWKYDNPLVVCTSNRSFESNYGVRLGARLRSKCVQYVVGEVSVCVVQYPCLCSSERKIYMAFRSRCFIYEIKYPLHSFLNMSCYDERVWQKFGDSKKTLLSKYSNHTPVNWLSSENHIFSKECLPSGYYQEYNLYRLEGGLLSYELFKREKQEEYLKKLRNI